MAIKAGIPIQNVSNQKNALHKKYSKTTNVQWTKPAKKKIQPELQQKSATGHQGVCRYFLAFAGVFTGRKPNELDIDWKGGFIVILVGAVIVNGLYSKIVICK